MTSLGMVVRPHVPPEQLLAIARVADSAGLEQLWLWEDSFFAGGIASAAAVLAATERLRVGIGVIPVPYRNVGLLAMEIATLERMFPGRLIPGVGHGNPDWMGQAGVRVSSPMTLLREYVTALRALLRGERLSVSGRYVRLDDVVLDWPPASAPPVLVGAVGPRTLRLAGEIGDGTVLDAQYNADGVRRIRAVIEEGRVGGGRTDPHDTVVYVTAVTGDGRAGPARHGTGEVEPRSRVRHRSRGRRDRDRRCHQRDRRGRRGHGDRRAGRGRARSGLARAVHRR